MTLLWTESWDGAGTTVANYGDGKWNSALSNGQIVAGKTGNCLQHNSGARWAHVFTSSDAHATFIAGFAYKQSSDINGIYIFSFMFEGETTERVRLRTANTRKFNLEPGSGVTVTNGSANNEIITNGVWQFVEIKVVRTGTTTGTAEVRVDGTTVINATLTLPNNGLDWGGFNIFDNASTTTVPFMDDLYICNGAGSLNNDFLGEVEVIAIFPNGNGNSSQFVGSDGNSTDNYLLVDETTPNDSDWVESSVDDEKDLYTYGDVSSANGVAGVMVTTRATWVVDAKEYAVVSRLSATEVDSADITPGSDTNFDNDVVIFETKPGGGAWTVTDVNNAEFGVKTRPV